MSFKERLKRAASKRAATRHEEKMGLRGKETSESAKREKEKEAIEKFKKRCEAACKATLRPLLEKVQEVYLQGEESELKTSYTKPGYYDITLNWDYKWKRRSGGHWDGDGYFYTTKRILISILRQQRIKGYFEGGDEYVLFSKNYLSTQEGDNLEPWGTNLATSKVTLNDPGWQKKVEQAILKQLEDFEF